jgi:outer membrane protein OmpA-like peptidoglycan-associated protein
MKKKLAILTAIAVVAVATGGCATRKFVRQEIGQVHHRADALESQTETQIEHMQTRLESTDAHVAEQGKEIEAVSDTAREALERAREAGKLAEGKLLYETTLSGDFSFGFQSTELGDQARAGLDELASRLKAENQDVYLEIQGHTDASGPEDFNLRLGEHRARAASRYLNMEHGIPLHRMATISYGESAPAVDNGTRDGRARNRRVVVVVLK